MSLTAMNTFWEEQLSFSGHPIIYGIYCISVAAKFRQTSSWTRQETLNNPIGSFISMLISCLLGPLTLIHLFTEIVRLEVLSQSLKNSYSLDIDYMALIAFIAWSLINYSPNDIVFKLCTENYVLNLLIQVTCSWKRSIDISKGVLFTKYPSSLVGRVGSGILRGWGGSLTFPVEAVIRSKSVPMDIKGPACAGFLTTIFHSMFLSMVFIAIKTTTFNKLLPLLAESEIQSSVYVLTVIAATLVTSVPSNNIGYPSKKQAKRVSKRNKKD